MGEDKPVYKFGFRIRCKAFGHFGKDKAFFISKNRTTVVHGMSLEWVIWFREESKWPLSLGIGLALRKSPFADVQGRFALTRAKYAQDKTWKTGEGTIQERQNGWWGIRVNELGHSPGPDDILEGEIFLELHAAELKPSLLLPTVAYSQEEPPLVALLMKQVWGQPSIA